MEDDFLINCKHFNLTECFDILLQVFAFPVLMKFILILTLVWLLVVDGCSALQHALHTAAVQDIQLLEYPIPARPARSPEAPRLLVLNSYLSDGSYPYCPACYWFGILCPRFSVWFNKCSVMLCLTTSCVDRFGKHIQFNTGTKIS